MKGRGIWTIVSVLVVLGLILASCAKAPAPTAPTTPTAPAVAPPKVTRIQSETSTPAVPMPERYPLLPDGSYYESLGDFIEKISGGRIEIDWAPYDSIVLWTEAFPGVSRGAVDLMPVLNGTIEGIIPESGVLNGLPLAWQNFVEAFDGMYQYGILNEVQPLFEAENVHMQSFAAGGFNIIMMKGLVTSMDQLKGKRVRAVGAMNRLMSRLGATALIIPYSEAYMAMKLGTIDGWVASPAVVDSYKFYETADMFTMVMYPTLGCWTNSFAWNLDVWKSLPADLRADIDTMVPMYIAWHAALRGDNWTRHVADYLVGTTGGSVKVVNFSEADANAITQAAFELWDNYAKTSPNMARLVEIMKKQQAALGRPFPGWEAGW